MPGTGSEGALAGTPSRLRLPKAQARVARSVFNDGFEIPDTTPIIRYIPIIQWGSIRIRTRITGAAGVLGFEFVRPAQNRNPDQATSLEAFPYTVDQPAIDTTAWVDGVELSLEITDTEHQGENWLMITATAAALCNVDFMDISGVNLGLSY